jgi:hypothetical protein
MTTNIVRGHVLLTLNNLDHDFLLGRVGTLAVEDTTAAM